MLIATERLDLRRMSRVDLDDLVALHAEPDVSRFIRPLDRPAALDRLRADEREWCDRGHGLLAVLQRDTGRFIGRVALRYWSELDETEVGWAFRREIGGRGYATEAARACADWGFRDFRVPYLTAMIRPDNARSIGVAERLGMTPLRTDHKRGIPVVVYSVTRESWPADSAARRTRDPSPASGL